MALAGLHTMTITLTYESTDNVSFTETAIFRVTVEQPVFFHMMKSSCLKKSHRESLFPFLFVFTIPGLHLCIT